ncbi:cyclin-A2-2-like [Trifolium pratense]|nr:cyclin-A2-2-like [Trifolium pratense]
MEKQVFKCVGRHLVDPTTNTFLRMFLVVARASTKLQCMSSFLAELSLMSQKFVPYLPSKVAASALFLARWTLDPTRHPWDESLQKFTTYESCELKNIVFYLQALQQQIEGNVCTTIRNKYSEPKFQNVAALSSKDLDDTMF